MYTERQKVQDMNILKTSITIVSVIAGSFLIPGRLQGQYYMEPSRIAEIKTASHEHPEVPAKVKRTDNQDGNEIFNNCCPYNLRYKYCPVVILSGCPSRQPVEIPRSHRGNAGRQPGRRLQVSTTLIIKSGTL